MNKKMCLAASFCLLLCLFGCAPQTPPSVRETRYAITVTECAFGRVVPSATGAYEGDTVTLTAFPDAHCALKEVRLSGAVLEEMKFVMPAKDVTVTAVFEQIGYQVLISDMEGGTLQTDKQTAVYGDTVTVTAVPGEGYSMKQGSLRVDGNSIKGNQFSMPAHDVTLSADFIQTEAFPESGCAVQAVSSNDTAEARWYAAYEQAGIRITVRVKDNTLSVGNSDFGYDDNVEFIIALKSDARDLDPNRCFKLLVSAGGKYYLQKAVNATEFGAPSDLGLNIAPGSNFYFSVAGVTYADGMGGYRVDVYLGYDLLNTTAEEAYGNLTISPALRNTNGMHSVWSTSNTLGAQWAKAYTFAAISADGKILPREYEM